MSVFGANRHELWVSIAVVVIAFFLDCVPTNYPCALILSGGMLTGLFCAINAALDMDEMGVIETYVAGYWLLFLMIITPLVIYGVANIHYFANK